MCVTLPISKTYNYTAIKNRQMAQQLRPSKPADKQSKIDWSRRQEAEDFAETVKLFRQGKIDPDMFRRFRLQPVSYTHLTLPTICSV